MSSKTIALFLSAILMGNLSATTWQVEKTGDDTAAAADSTGATPFKTIQAAVDKAAAGETVIVGDGVYDTSDGYTSNGNGKSLLYLQRAVTLKARNAGKTELVGLQSAENGGLGDDAVRCLLIKLATSGDGPEIVLQGLVLRDAGAANANNATGRGGAICVTGTTGKIFLVNCVISNCVSYLYALPDSARLLGCRVEGCRVTSAPTFTGGRAAFTLFANMKSEGAVETSRGVTAVNCTWTMSKATRDLYVYSSSASTVYNSLMTCSSGVVVQSGQESKLTQEDSILSDNGSNPLLAPALGDYRVRAGSAADSTGNAAWLDEIELPTGMTLDDVKDPFGNEIDRTRLHLGAVQETAAAAAGALQLGAGLRVDGALALVREAYFYPTNYPRQYRIEAELADGQELYGYTVSPVEMAPYRFPKPDSNHVFVTPSPDESVVKSVSATPASQVLWVEEGGTGTGTSESPFGTINDAVDAASACAIVRVRAGRYSGGARFHPEKETYGKAVVDLYEKQVRVVGCDGAERTFIIGSPDPVTRGLGSDAIRCVLMSSTSKVSPALQGFTLTGGFTLASGTGGGVMGRNSGCIVSDCIVSNNAASAAGALATVFAERCRVCDNAGTTAVGGSVLVASVVVGNQKVTGPALSGDTTVVGCSVVADEEPAFAPNTKVYGTAVAGGSADAAPSECAGDVFWQVGPTTGTGITYADPLFVKPVTGDLRVLRNSPVFASGERPTASNYGLVWSQYANTDFLGDPLEFVDGCPVVGAYGQGVPGVHVAAEKGGLTVPGGVTVLEGEATLEVAGTGVAERPCAGVIVGGVTNYFDDLPDGRYVVTAAAAQEGLDVLALYTSDWYLDPNGQDSNSGFTAKNARRRFSAALSACAVGDTLHLAAGTYADADDVMTDADSRRARAVIPDGVTVEGAANGISVIEGVPDDSQTLEGADGCGAAAVRCVILGGSAAAVKNCTLRNGYADLIGDDSSYKNGTANFGGGVFATKNVGGLVENCVISNCVAVRGAAAYSATLVKCRVVENRSTTVSGSGAAGMYLGSAYGTVFTGNAGPNWTVMNPTLLSGCSIIKNDIPASGTYDVILNNASQSLVNTLCDGPSTASAAGLISHCAFASDWKNVISADKTDGTCVFVPRTDLAVDDEGRPLVGANVAIDRGDRTAYPADVLGDADLTGFQRVMNAALDIGALEADWRAVYSKAAGVRHGSCLSASENVTTNAAGTVTLSNGDQIAFAVTPKAKGQYGLSAELTGAGALAISANDVDLEPLTSSGSVEFASSGATDVLRLSYAGEGTSSFLLAEPRAGMLLLFR